MVNCAKCGKKLGLFEKKFDYEDESGNPLKYCSKCNDEFEKEDNIDQNSESVSEPVLEMPSCFDTEKKRIEQISIRKLHLNEYNKNNERILEKLRIKSEPIPNKDFLKEVSSFCFICLKELNTNPYVNSNKEYTTINNFKVCSDCISKVEKTSNKLKTTIENLDPRLSKEANSETVKYIEKYLSSKDFDFKGIILGICRNKDLFGLIEEDDLDFLQEHFVKLYQQAQEHSPSTSADYDELMSLESTCNHGLQIIEDVKKIKKLLDKKEIKTDYIQIFEEMAQIVEHDMKKTIEKLTIPAYKRISKITTTDKELIIKEYLKLGFDEPNEMIIKDLFDKFGLEYSDSEPEHLLKDCLEEMELEDFENNLGLETKKKIGDFSKLNGHQFEDYLKELFSILGYQVMRTKLSGDQGADLIIKKDDMKTVVQAKKYAGTVTNKAIQEVVASKKHYGADKAMVVTTGTFTKSAIELAKSNKVEIWDKNKLKEIINSINKTSNKSKGFQNQQSLNLKGDTFPAHCPFCDSEIKLNVKDLPKKNKQKTLSCPECNVDLGISIPDNFYSCIGCKKEFDTVKERIDHSKLCKKVKERQFNCSHCNKEFTLDDDEFKEFTKKGNLKVECPACKKNNMLKK